MPHCGSKPRHLFRLVLTVVACLVGTAAALTTQSTEATGTKGGSPMAFHHLKVVAAGRGRSMCLPSIANAVLSLARQGTTGSPLRMVYLGTAVYDKEDAFHAQTHAYADRKVPPFVDVTKLDVSERIPPERMPSLQDIAETIAMADIIMVSGGNTLYAVNRWKQLGMDRMLRQRVEAPVTASSSDSVPKTTPVVLCGGSAGAIAWFAHGHSDSMDPTTFLNVDPNLTKQQKKDWKYIRVGGLGYLPNTLCVPHYDATQSNGLPRCQDSDEMLLQSGDASGSGSGSDSGEFHQEETDNTELVCVGIDENAALVVDQGLARVVGGGDRVDYEVNASASTGTNATAAKDGGNDRPAPSTPQCCHIKVVLKDDDASASAANKHQRLFHKVLESQDPGIPVDKLIDVGFWRALHNQQIVPTETAAGAAET